jgi:hypothetical protein
MVGAKKLLLFSTMEWEFNAVLIVRRNSQSVGRCKPARSGVESNPKYES